MVCLSIHTENYADYNNIERNSGIVNYKFILFELPQFTIIADIYYVLFLSAIKA